MSAVAHKNDIGISIIFDCEEDISGADVITMKYKKPGGDEDSFAGSAYLSNYAKYTTVDGDLDEAGIWSMQVYVKEGSVERHTDPDQFEIFDTLDG